MPPEAFAVSFETAVVELRASETLLCGFSGVKTAFPRAESACWGPLHLGARPRSRERAGSYTLAVEVKTSVCSDTKCLMKTERLTAKLTAE
jgi:hypothetical protein